ncbi:MAG TPA: hypothetical protein ENH85_06780 [Candidatus Scalindua sp.]|nr:hypothetical protein [Candidatus Scalindua sp.]
MTDYNIKKIQAFNYYTNPFSPTLINALGSLVRAGYNHSYTKSYRRKIFLVDRFIDVLLRGRKKEEG